MLMHFIVNELNKFVYDKRSAGMRTDFDRKYAAFSGQNPAQETLKTQAFCSFPIFCSLTTKIARSAFAP